MHNCYQIFIIQIIYCNIYLTTLDNYAFLYKERRKYISYAIELILWLI